jgi:hypothetical protein
LGKTIEEIDKRLLEINPNYIPANKVKPMDQTDKNEQSTSKKEGFLKRLFG